MKLRLEGLTESNAKEICSWKYSDEYYIYNYPEWNKIYDEKWGITVEEKRKNEFNAIIDDFSNLCGYIRLMNKDEYVLIGVGLKPSLCWTRLRKYHYGNSKTTVHQAIPQ